MRPLRVRIPIPDVTCGGCAGGAIATLREAAPAAAVTVDPGTREVQVATGDIAPPIAALHADKRAAVQAAG